MTNFQLELSSPYQTITYVIVEKYVYIFPVYVDNRKDCDVYEGDGLYIERL